MPIDFESTPTTTSGYTDINVEQLDGKDINLGAGAVDTGTQRVTLASDDPAVIALQILDDWDESDRAKVNLIAGQAGVAGNTGTISATTLRVTVATDDTVATDLTAIKTAIEKLDDWDESDRAKVNPIAGQAGVAGNTGTIDATTQRVTVATDDTVATDLTAIKTAIEKLDDWDNSDYCKTEMYGNDGTSNVIALMDSSGQQYVLQGALLPGEDDSNDLRKVKKLSIEGYTPTKTAATAVDENETEILESTEVIGYPNWTVWVKNVGGGSADTLANVIVYTSPDGTNWVDMDAAKTTLETACETLASGSTGIGFIVTGGSFRYVKVTANCGAGDDTTVDCWLTANVG